jgi:hypothetical protein
MIIQLTVELNDISPRIWRTIHVNSDIKLNQLHHVIQAAMGWANSHLYAFKIDDIDYSLPKYRADFIRFASSLEYCLEDFDETNIEYIYDFGDNWVHSIQIENKFDNEKVLHPVCIGGERKCPPEDVGGIPGFETFLEVIGDPLHPEHDEFLEWAGGSYEPNEFTIERVNKKLLYR